MFSRHFSQLRQLSFYIVEKLYVYPPAKHLIRTRYDFGYAL